MRYVEHSLFIISLTVQFKLLYTTFIATNCVVVLILCVIGVSIKGGSVIAWIALNCKTSLISTKENSDQIREHNIAPYCTQFWEGYLPT